MRNIIIAKWRYNRKPVGHGHGKPWRVLVRSKAWISPIAIHNLPGP